jgi:hypothetical protein
MLRPEAVCAATSNSTTPEQVGFEVKTAYLAFKGAESKHTQSNVPLFYPEVHL